MNLFNIANAFKQKAERKWHTLYVMVDAHGTIIKPYHDKLAFYEGSLEVLKWFSDRSDIKLILWTSSHEKESQELFTALWGYGINIDFVNANPLEKNSKLACFDKKFYFNIILDDKAGLEPEIDWVAIKTELQRIGEWENKECMTETSPAPAVKIQAIYIKELPLDAPNWVGYGQTGFVTSKPTDDFVCFTSDAGNKQFRINVKDLYFPQDVN